MKLKKLKVILYIKCVLLFQGNLAQFIKIRLSSRLEKSALDNCLEVVDELKRFIVVTNHPKQKGNSIKIILQLLPKIV